MLTAQKMQEFSSWIFIACFFFGGKVVPTIPDLTLLTVPFAGR